MSLQKT